MTVVRCNRVARGRQTLFAGGKYFLRLSSSTRSREWYSMIIGRKEISKIRIHFEIVIYVLIGMCFTFVCTVL